jgi:hypothetical protein
LEAASSLESPPGCGWESSGKKASSSLAEPARAEPEGGSVPLVSLAVFTEEGFPSIAVSSRDLAATKEFGRVHPEANRRSMQKEENGAASFDHRAMPNSPGARGASH